MCPGADDAYGFAQYLLDHSVDERARVAEARRRRDLAHVSTQTWPSVVEWSKRSRLVRDYVAAARTVAQRLCLGLERADVIHELAGREGYELRPTGQNPPRGPAPAVASKIGADLASVASWESGATANRDARYRFTRSLDNPTHDLPFRVEMDASKIL